MITILPIDPRVQKQISRHSLHQKFEKQCALLVENFRHPSLHDELLEPKWRGIHSFRIDRKYRAIYFKHEDTDEIEIIDVTVHYQ